MSRICFQLQLRPERLDEYRERHAAVWPEMLEALRDAGRRNYSLFLCTSGLLVGYYETDNDEASRTALERDPRTRRWENEMAEFFVGVGARPDQAATPLTEIFNLDEQLAASAELR